MICCILPDLNGMKLKIEDKRKHRNCINTKRLNNSFWENLKNSQNQMKMEIQHAIMSGYSQPVLKGKVSYQSLYKKIRKISNKYPNHASEHLRKPEQTKTNTIKGKKYKKTEINEIQLKLMIHNTNKTELIL